MLLVRSLHTKIFYSDTKDPKEFGKEIDINQKQVIPALGSMEKVTITIPIETHGNYVIAFDDPGTKERVWSQVHKVACDEKKELPNANDKEEEKKDTVNNEEADRKEESKKETDETSDKSSDETEQSDSVEAEADSNEKQTDSDQDDAVETQEVNQEDAEEGDGE